MSDDRQVNTFIESRLDELSEVLEQALNAHVVALVGPIYHGLEAQVRKAIEQRANTTPEGASKQRQLALVLHTTGGIIEVVERIVNCMRKFYEEVIVIVPDSAMSAGTVLALSADRIMMDYFSCLGPIDPQLARDNKLVPALSYLVQYDRFVEKSKDQQLTTAELYMLNQLDLAELHKFEEAKELSISLLKEWLAKYKFKDWDYTETAGSPVTDEMREARAYEIADALMDHQRWHSHARPITIDVLKEGLNLRIENLSDSPDLRKGVHDYHEFLIDYMDKIGIRWCVHSKGVYLK